MSPLEAALEHWAAGDSLGGFVTVGALLLPGWVAKHSCRAPHREDHSPSFSIYQGEDAKYRFEDHGGGGGSLVAFVALSGRGITSASRCLIDGAGVASSPRRAGKAPPAPRQVPPQPVLDWNACAAAFSDDDPKVRKKRGSSDGICTRLRENRLIGIYEGCFAFPVHDDVGIQVAARAPKGTRVRPLVFGDLATADQVRVLESQWDALAKMEGGLPA